MSETLSQDMVKIIANPQLLARIPLTEKVDISYADNLKKVLQEKYKDVYLNEQFMKEIMDTIEDKIRVARDIREIQSCVNSLVERCVADNSFSFMPKRNI